MRLSVPCGFRGRSRQHYRIRSNFFSTRRRCFVRSFWTSQEDSDISVNPCNLQSYWYRSVQDTKDLLDATTNSWKQAAKNKISLMIATSIINVAFAVFEETEQRLKTSCDVSNSKNLYSTFMKKQQELRLTTNKRYHSNFYVKWLIEALRRSWHFLLDMKG